MILIWGYRSHLNSMGWSAQECSRCKKVQAFECFDNVRANHVYFIYGEEKSVGQVLQCSFCGTGYAPRQKGSLAIDNRWKRLDGLQALVDKTNPELGKLPPSDKPTRQELFALLESVNERSNPFTLNTGGGWIMEAVIGGIGCALLFVLLFKLGLVGFPDEFGAIMLGLIVGGFGGAIVGTFRTKSRQARELAEEILIDSMQRNSVTVEMLRRALKHHPKSLRYASSAIAQLEAA